MASGEGELESRISDEDLIEGYLRPKVNEEAIAIPRFIVDNMGEELYTREPWLLPQPTDPMLNPREWFYFGKRNRKYLQAEGVHFEGSWIPVERRFPILSEESGEVIGGMMRFTYIFRDKNDKDANMQYSNWFMREYRLVDKFRNPVNTRHVLCKITCNH